MHRTVLLFLVALGGCAAPAFSQGDGAPPASEPTIRATASGTASGTASAKRGTRTDIDIETFASRHAEGVKVIDVRTPGEYASGRVPGALHVPMDRANSSAPELADHPRDEPVYVVCEVGGRSARIADRLAKEGYTVVNVSGGTAEWIARGHTVER